MRIAVVTGASSGIGREFALQIPRLYRNLDELWVMARRTEYLEELKKNVSIPVRIFDGDMQRDYIFERLEKELDRQEAKIRMLVNAAGYGKVGVFSDIEPKEQLGMITLNCHALTKISQICLPYLSNGSRIVNIASSAAFTPQPGFAVYAASKSYVYSFSQALRRELLSKGIFVTVVCPGPVDTEFFRRCGKLPNPFKDSVKAAPKCVVRKALEDSVKKKRVSVYGPAMKCARAVTKIVPDALTVDLLGRLNQIGRSLDEK
ncbi:MAG: SDR family NAD(P)-dependent oxidoreductase [Dorea sp.]|jgi:Short-chain dehydrogenases of various substrate specificities|uniref:SDR family NAD(P)-dependent oxidoreductase n=1 Tax=Sporofaciens musculi TaxID=2681861 RepID=UPI00216B9166|nr:SDR family NAD(P)-dependent oxidoreductase [Sporofaciens musculi]MCI9421693.1 SDR family NAD(P)-dependent oxidoreductase [Dorea sp.]